MITEHHKEKRHAPAVLLLSALTLGLFFLPVLPRQLAAPAASPAPARDLATPIIPFAPALPTEPVRGWPAPEEYDAEDNA